LLKQSEEGYRGKTKMKKITKTTLKKWNACGEGYERFCELFPKGADLQTASKRFIEDSHPDWSNWLWVRCAGSDDDKYIQQCVVKSGDRGTATAGDEGTATAGDRGTATAGDRGTATAGYRGTATAGNRGTATAGYEGTATAGDEGTATAGDEGTATAGDEGTATAGYRGTATAGNRGTATAGYEGIIILTYWDNDDKKYKRKMSFVGEDGLELNTSYRLDENHNFVEVENKEVTK
jgi:hypothetical protein